MPATLAQIGRRFWMPDPGSSYAGQTDALFYFIYWVSVAMFVLIVTLMVVFVIRYRHRAGRVAPRSPSHSTALELTWSAIPAAVMLLIFFMGFRAFINLATPPDYAYEIQVTAYKWGWSFGYPNGATSPELHVPLDRPVKLVLASQDVIHGLYIPAFRIKRDVVPGRYNTTWFQATDPGPLRADGQRYYDLFCTQYCGTKHSMMRTKVIVQDATEFARWLDDAANWVQRTPPAEAGAKLFVAKGCTQCHSADGSAGIGPSFRNVFGHEVTFSDGSKLVAEENYIREHILTPGKHVVAGYQNVMPAYQGRIKDLEITGLIEWMKTLSDKGPPPLKAFPTTAPSTQPGTGNEANHRGAATS